MLCLVFFFKQKTAYEMRISDWSSDVCSSDLLGGTDDVRLPRIAHAVDRMTRDRADQCAQRSAQREPRRAAQYLAPDAHLAPSRLLLPVRTIAKNPPRCAQIAEAAALSQARSEEHTSELQSLMRISYAVFCLKKKNK